MQGQPAKAAFWTIAALCGAVASTAVSAAEDPTPSLFINGADLKWGPAPPALPKGARVAVLYGDPFKSGVFVIRLMAPAGYKIPPHWHTQAENLTVISGVLNLGEGDEMAKGPGPHAHALKAGGYHYLPAKAHHYAYATVPTVVQIHGEGPFDINYINEKEDPQKAAGK
ncbi:MAG TPA: cupin domain-containing protein [Casimicrobiaceae bacterium]|jgi:hypothetical protein